MLSAPVWCKIVLDIEAVPRGDTMDIIDTRDLIEELEGLAGESAPEDQGRAAALSAVLDEIGEEAQYGVALVPESEFEDYARELAEDIGAIPEDNRWPCYCIDWGRAANDLRVDYLCITFDGDDYLYRA